MWAETKTYQHVFTTKPSIGDNTLSAVTWTVAGTNLNNYNSGYAGVQFGTSKNNGAISLTSKNEWGAESGTNYEGYTVVKEVRVWINAGSGTPTLSVKIGGVDAESDGTAIQKNSSANTYTNASKVTFSPGVVNTGTVIISATCPNAAYLCAIEIDCEEPSSIVPVTGITLNKTTTSIPNGETETLVATVIPENATKQTITWTSSNMDVATVSAGVVTAVGVGTSTITATTVDGDFTASCDVTVTPAAVPSVTLDFTSNSWNFPVDLKEEGPETYTNNGYSITLYGKNNGFYFDSTAENLLLGKTDATLTLPAFPFNVKSIKVYGYEGASGSVSFNIFVGNNAVSTEATSSKITHSFAIDNNYQTAGNIYVLKVTNSNNARITKVAFYAANNKIVGENRAFLQTSIAPSNARLSIGFGEEATGVFTVNASRQDVNESVFDLQGRRVSQPTKGLYLI